MDHEGRTRGPLVRGPQFEKRCYKPCALTGSCVRTLSDAVGRLIRQCWRTYAREGRL